MLVEGNAIDHTHNVLRIARSFLDAAIDSTSRFHGHMSLFRLAANLVRQLVHFRRFALSVVRRCIGLCARGGFFQAGGLLFGALRQLVVA